MQIRSIQAGELEAARRLLRENGWERVNDADEFRLLISRSQHALVALANGEVVGFARALSDGLSNGYITMLVVADSHRRKGVGRALIDAIVGNDRRMTWILNARRPDLPLFYEKLGFTRSTDAMERRRATS